MGTNKVILYKRPDNKLELIINGLVAKSNFTSNVLDTTTRNEIDTYLHSSDGTNRLSGTYQDSTTNVSYITDATNNLFDGTNQINIKFVNLL